MSKSPPLPKYTDFITLRDDLAASQRREDTAKRTVSEQALIIKTLRARLEEHQQEMHRAMTAESLDLHARLEAAEELAQEWEEMARDDVGGLRILYADHADMLRQCLDGTTQPENTKHPAGRVTNE